MMPRTVQKLKPIIVKDIPESICSLFFSLLSCSQSPNIFKVSNLFSRCAWTDDPVEPIQNPLRGERQTPRAGSHPTGKVRLILTFVHSFPKWDNSFITIGSYDGILKTRAVRLTRKAATCAFSPRDGSVRAWVQLSDGHREHWTF